MRCCLVVAITLVSTVLPQSSASGQSSSSEQPSWSFSLGVDPININRNDLGHLEASMVGNLTKSWQSANSGFGRHLSLMVGADLPLKTDPSYSYACYGCPQRVSSKYAALTGGATFDVVRISRFTPYLKAGAGVYYQHLGLEMDPRSLPDADLRYYRSGFSLGGNAGLGIRARFGSRELFVEQILHAFDLRVIDKGVYPLNIGIRF